jgi:hypothetical protein
VETLILERHKIRAYPDFESDSYNNLLIIENKIKELAKNGTIEPFELAILDYVSTNKSYDELEELLGISRQVISKYFSNICNKISFNLGGIFTDAGYLEYMKENYRLSEEEIEIIQKHIDSPYKHTIRRLINND